MRLEQRERVITRAFALSGITTFSSYIPDSVPLGDAVCGRTGVSRLYVVLTTNANSVLRVSNQPQRYREVPDLVTNPYVEQSATKNTSASNPGRRQAEPLRRHDHGDADAQAAHAAELPVRQLHDQHHDDPIGHRHRVHRTGTDLHRREELEGVLSMAIPGNPRRRPAAAPAALLPGLRPPL